MAPCPYDLAGRRCPIWARGNFRSNEVNRIRFSLKRMNGRVLRLRAEGRLADAHVARDVESRVARLASHPGSHGALILSRPVGPEVDVLIVSLWAADAPDEAGEPYELAARGDIALALAPLLDS